MTEVIDCSDHVNKNFFEMYPLLKNKFNHIYTTACLDMLPLLINNSVDVYNDKLNFYNDLITKLHEMALSIGLQDVPSDNNTQYTTRLGVSMYLKSILHKDMPLFNNYFSFIGKDSYFSIERDMFDYIYESMSIEQELNDDYKYNIRREVKNNEGKSIDICIYDSTDRRRFIEVKKGLVKNKLNVDQVIHYNEVEPTILLCGSITPECLEYAIKNDITVYTYNISKSFISTIILNRECGNSFDLLDVMSKSGIIFPNSYKQHYDYYRTVTSHHQHNS